MNDTILFEISYTARIIESFSQGKRFERFIGGRWTSCPVGDPLRGLRKGEARKARKALRKWGFADHLRRSL